MENYDWTMLLVKIIETSYLKNTSERITLKWLSKAKRISKKVFNLLNKELFIKSSTLTDLFFKRNEIHFYNKNDREMRYIKSIEESKLCLYNMRLKDKIFNKKDINDKKHTLNVLNIFKSMNNKVKTVYFIKCRIDISVLTSNLGLLYSKSEEKYKYRIIFISCEIIDLSNFTKNISFNKQNTDLMFISCKKLPCLKLINQNNVYIDNCSFYSNSLIDYFNKQSMINIVSFKKLVLINSKFISINNHRIDCFLCINNVRSNIKLSEIDSINIQNNAFNLLLQKKSLDNYKCYERLIDNDFYQLGIYVVYIKNINQHKNFSVLNNTCYILNSLNKESKRIKPSCNDISTFSSLHIEDKQYNIFNIKECELLDILHSLNDVKLTKTKVCIKEILSSNTYRRILQKYCKYDNLCVKKDMIKILHNVNIKEYKIYLLQIGHIYNNQLLYDIYKKGIPTILKNLNKQQTEENCIIISMIETYIDTFNIKEIEDREAYYSFVDENGIKGVFRAYSVKKSLETYIKYYNILTNILSRFKIDTKNTSNSQLKRKYDLIDQ